VAAVPLDRKLLVLRWALPIGVLLLAMLHEALIALLVGEPARWQGWIALAVYGVTGSVVGWIWATWIANAVGRRAEAEGRLREAFDELERNHGDLLALHDMGQFVQRAEDEQTVLEVAAEGSVKLTGAKGSTVVTFDDERDVLNLDMAWGLSDDYLSALRRRVDFGIDAGRCRTCHTLKTEMTSDCPLAVGLGDVALQEGLQSLICVPMVNEQDRVGVVSAYFTSLDGPPEDQVRLLDILTGAVAGSLAGLQLREKMGTISSVDATGDGRRDSPLESLAAQVLDIAVAGWQVPIGGLLLRDDSEDDGWSWAAQRGLDEEARRVFASQLAARAREQGVPVIVPEVAAANGGRDAAAAGHGLASGAAAPLIAEGRVVGVLFLGAERPRALVARHTDLLSAVARQIALAIRNAQLTAKLGEMAVLEERFRLSREIHDGLAQSLSYLGLQGERVEKLVARSAPPEEVLAELGEMRRAIRASYVDARESIDGLRLAVDEPESLSQRLSEYVVDFSRQSGIEAVFQSHPNPVSTDSGVALQLLRIAQEALTNVRKHAGARCVELALVASDAELELTVADDGKGFATAEEREHREREHRAHGLSSMRERAASLGGALTVATRPGQGTRIVVTVPVDGTHDQSPHR